MKKTTSIIAMIVVFALNGVSAARAQQTSQQPETKTFVSISAGGQFGSQTFSSSSTFPLYGETATTATNQAVGGGFVFDASGSYRVWRNLAVGIGIWTFNGSGTAAGVASIPDPLQTGHPTIVNGTASDLKQTDVGVNFQAVWVQPVTDRIDVAIFGGPTLIHVSQDVATMTIASNAQTATMTTSSQSGTTGKAGNVGVDASYKLTKRYRAGVFIRYAGGTINLPIIGDLTVGGAQLGGGVRIRF
jgi:hypothetical protein